MEGFRISPATSQHSTSLLLQSLIFCVFGTTTLAEAPDWILEMAGFFGHKIKIHNDSAETITLIPFTRGDGENLHAKFPVNTELVKEIPKKNYRPVNCEDYDLKVPGFQTHMLFRAEKCSKMVEPGKGENIFLWTGLAAKTEWHLSLDKKRVIGGPDNVVGPTSSGANAAESQLEDLTKKVEELQNKVRDLEQKVALLQNALAQR